MAPSVSRVRDLLLLLHILSAMTWFGAGAWGLIAVRRVQRVQGTEEADILLQKMELVENRVFPPAAILVLLSGVGLVLNGSAGWGDMFVYLGMTGVIVSMALGGAVGGRLNRELADAREAGDTVKTAGLVNRWLNLGRIELLILLVIVALMVYKPL